MRDTRSEDAVRRQFVAAPKDAQLQEFYSKAAGGDAATHNYEDRPGHGVQKAATQSASVASNTAQSRSQWSNGARRQRATKGVRTRADTAHTKTAKPMAPKSGEPDQDWV